MKETILLIEDEVELQQNLKEILEFNGFIVFTADNGQEALLMIGEQRKIISLFNCRLNQGGILVLGTSER